MPTAKKKISPLMRKYNAIKKVKAKNCAGKATVAQVKKVVNTYVKAAEKKGQTRAEATRKANAITTRACAKPAVGATRKRKRR